MSRADGWYATVEHYRAWLFADGGFVRSYNRSGGFTPELVRRMARHYSVARTIPSVMPKDDGQDDQDADLHRGIIADALNNLAETWPTTLPERAAAIVASAQRACNQIGQGNPPYSAFSKFIWFARRDNWTLYDSLASAGMLPSDGTSEQRVCAFYSALEPTLPGLVARLQPICDESGLTLFGEKIVDIFLMLRGARRVRPSYAVDLTAGCDDFMALLPQDVARRLDDCATQLSLILTNDALPRPTRVAWRKREVRY